MSTKIPQSEWDAIVARRRQGEPVASIARSYGCSPPLIYRILSRQQGDAPETTDATAAVADLPEPEAAPVEAAASARPEPAAPAADPASARAAEPVPAMPAPSEPAPIVVERAAAARPQIERAPEPLPRPERPTALSASLDPALRAEIEETINAFRSAFDAALTESSADARAALRAAASDLMRAGARTTIVLERLAAPSRAHPPFPGRNGGDRPSLPLPVPPRRPAPPAAEAVAPAPALAPGESVRMTGAVKWYNAEKGFGFIAVESGHRDVFVRASALQRSGLASLAEGQQVTLEVTQGRKGPEAIEVRLAE
jgi:cold shock CspA family protein